MNKSVFAIAVCATFSSAALAQTNVTTYGVVDLAIARTDNGAPAGSLLRMISGQWAASRLGFRGKEDLGGGLSTIFQLETGYSVDTGAQATAGVLFNRQSWLGMEGGFGTVRFGRIYTPYYRALAKIDPFDDGLFGAFTTLIPTGGNRTDNTINFQTPNKDGFSGEAAYSFGEVVGDMSANRAVTLKGAYSSGPVEVVLSRHQVNNSAAVGGATKLTMVGGTYDFKVVKAHVSYDWVKADSTRMGTTTDARDLLLGVSARLGTGKLMASYIRKSDKLTANADSKRAAIGYGYPLSKRTVLYTSYARNTNEKAARYNLDATALAGATYSGVQFGICHKF